MDGSVFLPVCDVNQDISIADAHVINGGEPVPEQPTCFVAVSGLELEKLFCIALLADCAWLACWLLHVCSIADALLHSDAFGCHVAALL